MRGQVAKARSNANYQSGIEPSANNCGLPTIHTWRNDKRSHDREVGAFEMKFDKPTSLVSLNIDITFECQDSSKLLHSLSPEIQSALTDSSKPTAEQTPTDQVKIQTSDASNATADASKSLGIFSAKGFSDDLQRALKADS